MSDVFISYKREDEGRVERLQRGMKEAGLDVWWDKNIPGGDAWRDRIPSELKSAKCVLVIWSEHSTGPHGGIVKEEAGLAHGFGTLLQVRIDKVTPPFGFGEQQALDLVGWKGNVGDPRFADVVAAVQAKVTGGPMPVPSGVKRRERRRALTMGAVVVGVVSVVFGARLPVVRSAACGVSGLRGLVSRTESKDGWKTEQRRLPLEVRAGTEPLPSEDAARADALVRGPQEAQDVCVGFSQGEFRLRKAEAVPAKSDCRKRAGGYVCGFSGEALCDVSVRYQQQVEICP